MKKLIILALLFISALAYAQNTNSETGARISAADAQKVLDHHNMVRKEVGGAEDLNRASMRKRTINKVEVSFDSKQENS